MPASTLAPKSSVQLAPADNVAQPVLMVSQLANRLPSYLPKKSPNIMPVADNIH